MLVAQTPPDAGSVVNKALLVEDADKLVFEVISSSVNINQLTVATGAEMDSHGIDGEVATEEVFFDGAGLHCGQGAGLGIGLGAGGG